MKNQISSKTKSAQIEWKQVDEDECTRNTNKHTKSTIRNRNKKEPLPMKFRAFPQSFWQQPNRTPSVSPGTVYCASLLLNKDENASDNRSIVDENLTKLNDEIVSEANTDLLFSLFRRVDEEQKKTRGKNSNPTNRRGRPRKTKSGSKVIRDDDPYLISSAAETLLHLLPNRNTPESLQSKISNGEQILAMISIDNSSSVNLLQPLNTNQNYSQILSDLVVQL